MVETIDKSPRKPLSGAGKAIPVHCAFKEMVEPNKLKPHPRNPNKHGERQISLLARIIEHQGWRAPITVSRRSGFVVAGHGRLQAATKLGLELVPVDFQDFSTEADEHAHLVADNRIAELAEIDETELSSILKDLDGKLDLDLTGFDGDALAELHCLSERDELEVEPLFDKADELRRKWCVEPGQIWQLAEHRLMCGDCRTAEDVDRLFGPAPGNRCNIAFTSPPYASQRQYDETSGFRPIPPDEFVEWFKPVQENLKRQFQPDGSWFINIKPCSEGLDTSLYVFDLVIAHVRSWGWHFATEFCWERNGVPKSVTQRFKNQFEPIYQFALNRWKMRPEAVRHKSDNVPIPFGKGAGNTSWANRQGGNGAMFGGVKRRKSGTGRAMSDVQGTTAAPGEFIGPGLAFPGNRLPPFTESHEATGHTAAFPVGLPSFFIQAFTDPGDVVYEPFSGSGTTIIACEQLGRKCRAMEISPGYVAVGIQRWADATGGTPTLLNG